MARLAPPNASPVRRLAPAPTAPGRCRICHYRGKSDSLLGIFVDGGYVTKVSVAFQIWVDIGRLGAKIRERIAENTFEPLDVVRTYYYDCLPYQSDPPTAQEAQRFSQKRRFFAALQHLPRCTVREGRLMYRGQDAHGEPIFQQKRVDLMIGLDFALLAAKHQITHAAVVTGDSDLLPAFEVAQREGVVVCLVHGPRSTYASDLRSAADERIEMDRDFMEDVKRETRPA